MSVSLHSNFSFDYLAVSSEIPETTDIEISRAENFIPDWSSFSGLEIMCGYTSKIYSSYIDNLTSDVVAFAIYRQNDNESILHKVAEVPKEQLKVIDYMIQNNRTYRWSVLPLTNTEQGVVLPSASIKTNWDAWSVTSLQEVEDNVFIGEETWTFYINSTPDSFVQNLNKVQLSNYTQYPKYSIGETNFISGGLSTLIGDVECETQQYRDTVEKWDGWRKFVASGKNCLLKDYKGHIYRVQIESNQYDQMYEISDPPTKISFSFSEIGSCDNISVYG